MVLLAGALLGTLLSAGGLVLVWVEAPRAAAGASGLMDLAARSLDTTQSGLSLISSSLDQSRQSIQLMESTAAEIGTSLDQTVPMVHSTANLVGDNMTSIISKTQSSLASARASAQFVDDTIGLINSLPLLGKRYASTGSLSGSIEQVSKSLDGLPASLTALSGDLNASADNLQQIHDRVDGLSGDIRRMDASAAQAQDVVRRYQALVSELQADAAAARKNAPGIIQAVKWAATLFFLWLAAAQVGLALQGVEMLAPGKRSGQAASAAEPLAVSSHDPDGENGAAG